MEHQLRFKIKKFEITFPLTPIMIKKNKSWINLLFLYNKKNQRQLNKKLLSNNFPFVCNALIH